jgi:hypothetical protein
MELINSNAGCRRPQTELRYSFGYYIIASPFSIALAKLNFKVTSNQEPILRHLILLNLLSSTG